jgi:hypothetical protein
MRDANPGGGQGHRWPADGTTRWSRRVLRAIAWLIPAGRREACLEEWEAELWQLRTGDVGVTPAAVFLAGLTIHGLWEWKEGWRMESIVQDVRFAVRTLTRSPGFALAAILMLATSIGASTALFSVLEKAVLADPPFPEPQRLVVVDQLFGHTPEEMNASRWSYPRFKDLAEEVGSLQAVGGYRARTMTLSEMGDPAVVSVEVITPSLLPMLGVTPRLGRAFGPDEEDDGAPAMTALVSHGFWQSRFGGSPDAVGAVLTLDGLRMQVVGVLPADFAGVTGGVDIWVPMSALREIGDPGYLEDPWNLHFHVIGRLKPEATVESVRAELQSLAARMSDRYPAPEGASNLIASADVLSYREARTNPRARASMLALFGAVLLVLLMATANLAGLVMARGATRVREAAVRASLGAARSRLVRQFMTESLILALVGGVAGIVLAGFGVNLLGTWLSNALGTTGGRELQYLNPEAQGIDWTVVAFAGILTACVGVAFGLVPAWQGARADPNTAMRGGRTQTLGNRWSALPLGRNGLIAVQVALAMVLLTGATVMMNGLRSLQDVSLGYDRENLFTRAGGVPHHVPGAYPGDTRCGPRHTGRSAHGWPHLAEPGAELRGPPRAVRTLRRPPTAGCGSSRSPTGTWRPWESSWWRDGASKPPTTSTPNRWSSSTSWLRRSTSPTESPSGAASASPGRSSRSMVPGSWASRRTCNWARWARPPSVRPTCPSVRRRGWAPAS